MNKSLRRTFFLLLFAACVLCMMLSMAAIPCAPVQAQAQDATLSAIEADRLRRVGELAATRAAQEAAARQATAVRQMTVQAQNDRATATAQAIAATATADERQFRLTATAGAWEAQQTVTARAEATQNAQATATRSAETTATAQARATQNAQATGTVQAATATADAIAFAEQIHRQEEQDRIEAESRQRRLNQVRQAVYVIGALVLVVLAGGLAVFSLRLIWAWGQPRLSRGQPPVQIVEIVPGPLDPLTQNEAHAEANGARCPVLVTVDSEAAAQMYDYLRREGVAPSNSVIEGG